MTPEAAHEALETRAIAWIFGDDDEDPGLIAEEGAKSPAFTTWLAAFARDYPALKSTQPGSQTSLAGARIAALQDDIARRRAGAVDWSAARADNVRSLSAARTNRSSRTNPTRLLAIGGAVLAAAAAVFLLIGRNAPPDVDAPMALALTAEIAPDGGMGFAGSAPPSARDRGFLIGAVIDLSRNRKDGTKPGEPERSLATTLADRALKGLDGPTDGAALERARGGCAAILVHAADRSDCELGLADYIARRDALASK